MGILEIPNECKKYLNKNILEEFLESSEESVERKICECKEVFRTELGREKRFRKIENHG